MTITKAPCTIHTSSFKFTLAPPSNSNCTISSISPRHAQCSGVFFNYRNKFYKNLSNIKFTTLLCPVSLDQRLFASAILQPLACSREQLDEEHFCGTINTYVIYCIFMLFFVTTSTTLTSPPSSKNFVTVLIPPADAYFRKS